MWSAPLASIWGYHNSHFPIWTALCFFGADHVSLQLQHHIRKFIPKTMDKVMALILSMLMAFLNLALHVNAVPPGSALSSTYYDGLCPGGTKRFQTIASTIVAAKVIADPTLIPALARYISTRLNYNTMYPIYLNCYLWTRIIINGLRFITYSVISFLFFWKIIKVYHSQLLLQDVFSRWLGWSKPLHQLEIINSEWFTCNMNLPWGAWFRAV